MFSKESFTGGSNPWTTKCVRFSRHSCWGARNKVVEIVSQSALIGTWEQLPMIGSGQHDWGVLRGMVPKDQLPNILIMQHFSSLVNHSQIVCCALVFLRRCIFWTLSSYHLCFQLYLRDDWYHRYHLGMIWRMVRLYTARNEARTILLRLKIAKGVGKLDLQCIAAAGTRSARPL